MHHLALLVLYTYDSCVLYLEPEVERQELRAFSRPVHHLRVGAAKNQQDILHTLLSSNTSGIVLMDPKVMSINCCLVGDGVRWQNQIIKLGWATGSAMEPWRHAGKGGWRLGAS